MTLSRSFTDTKVPLERSMNQCEGLLDHQGIREQRYTHLKPEDPEAAEGDEALGRLIYEFAYPGDGTENSRRGVRFVIAYQPKVIKVQRGGDVVVKGTTDRMAARALYWMLKAKFDAVEYGIEEFDVAFMPHLVTELGWTFADRPELIAEVMALPDSITQLALPAPRERKSGA